LDQVHDISRRSRSRELEKGLKKPLFGKSLLDGRRGGFCRAGGVDL